jgi:hypothetical protein
VPEDKTILLALTLLLLMLLLRGSHISIHVKQLNLFISNSMLCIFLAALVGAFKWLSVFYLLPLLVYLSHDTREFIKNMIWFCIWVALAHLPWFPAWSFVYAFRSARIAFPLHTAPAVLINALGVYSPALLLALLAISLFAIYGLFWLKHIDVFETIALSTMVGIWWTPDMDPVHLSVVVLMILLVIDWASRARQLAIWTLSFLVAAVYAISTHDGIARYGLQFFTGRYGSLQMILLSYPLFVGVLAFYLWDKWHRNAIGRAVIAPEVVER